MSVFPYSSKPDVNTALSAVERARHAVEQAKQREREAKRELNEILAKHNKKAADDGRDLEWQGCYSNGTGRYARAWHHLEHVLVPASGPAETHVGNILRAFMKLFYRLNNDGELPSDYWDENTSYFHDMGVNADDVCLDDAPCVSDEDVKFDDGVQADWVETFLETLFAENEIPECAKPLPGPVSPDWRIRFTSTPEAAKEAAKRRRTLW